MYKQDTKVLNGDDQYEGFAVDVIKELSVILKFNYTFIIQEDKESGEKLPNNSWDGMIGRLIREVIRNL